MAEFHFFHKVGVTGFEPATSRSQSARSSQAELHPDKVRKTVLHLDIPSRVQPGNHLFPVLITRN